MKIHAFFLSAPLRKNKCFPAANSAQPLALFEKSIRDFTFAFCIKIHRFSFDFHQKSGGRPSLQPVKKVQGIVKGRNP